ncbi:hypothetical protein [Aeromicrobium sp.]|uniref:hypothetical protein n=1 Tax=Aeromicrobium sp. TaxID=1871063 RepID=UPI003C4594FE
MLVGRDLERDNGWMIRVAALGCLAALLLGASACGNELDQVALPDGVVVHIDQSRVERKGRVLFLRVENNTRRDLTIRKYVLTSPRFATVRWSGMKQVGATYEADLQFTMPLGRCGTDIAAMVRLTYRLGAGPAKESTARADDRYGNAADFADRDCARTTLEAAARIVVGEPRVSGAGRASVLQLPVTMTPSGHRDDVRFAGFGSTVLFRQAPDSPARVDVPLGPGDPPAALVMTVVPARCDPHALAEDKVGRLFPVKVVADGVGEQASYFLPLSRSQRKAFLDYFRERCGLL